LRGGTLGERHLKTAARLASAVAVLADRHARNSCEQRLGHTAHLGVIGRQGAKGAAVALDDEASVEFFELRETA
jgi:hypothetical protein